MAEYEARLADTKEAEAKEAEAKEAETSEAVNISKPFSYVVVVVVLPERELEPATPGEEEMAEIKDIVPKL